MHLFRYLLPCLPAFTSTLAAPQWGNRPNGQSHGNHGRHSTTAAAVAGTVASNPAPTTSSVAGNNPPGSSPTSTGGSSSGASSVASSPSPSGASVCDATSTLTDDGYTIMANIWGATPGVGGSQCAQAAGTSGSGIAWSTTWNWDSGTNIKSFANANGNSNVPCKAVDDIANSTGIPSTWSWSYSTDSIKADVAYDMFLGGSACSPVGGHPYEVMIWLAYYGGLGPIGYPSSKKGTFAYQSHSFDIYSGPNTAGGINTVYSFYPTTGNIENFSGNLLPFLQYLKTIDGGIGEANLQSIQAGTETVTGSATFSVSEYSIGGG